MTTTMNVRKTTLLLPQVVSTMLMTLMMFMMMMASSDRQQQTLMTMTAVTAQDTNCSSICKLCSFGFCCCLFCFVLFCFVDLADREFREEQPDQKRHLHTQHCRISNITRPSLTRSFFYHLVWCGFIAAEIACETEGFETLCEVRSNFCDTCRR